MNLDPAAVEAAANALTVAYTRGAGRNESMNDAIRAYQAHRAAQVRAAVDELVRLVIKSGTKATAIGEAVDARIALLALVGAQEDAE